MSIFSQCTIKAETSEEMRSIGHSLAQSVDRRDLTILLTGELGVGKTTFTQGFASGLGIKDRVQSPSFALEQRYAGFTHIDLYRLSNEQAVAFLAHSQDAIGIRVIEWAERIDAVSMGPHIHLHLSDSQGTRTITCDFLDEPVPDDAQIDTWITDVRLPRHIQAHIAAVTRIADTLADALIRSRKSMVRREALHAAARTHDLLRFVDFPSWNGDDLFVPTDLDRAIWKSMRERYGIPHEQSAARFLGERGFAAIGEMVRTHRGVEKNGTVSAKTVEQKLLAYSDKRVMFDQIVSLDERFDDLIKRYGARQESTDAKQWRAAMKCIETELFPRGAPTSSELE